MRLKARTKTGLEGPYVAEDDDNMTGKTCTLVLPCREGGGYSRRAILAKTVTLSWYAWFRV